MKVLIICSYRTYMADGIAPFIKEQINALTNKQVNELTNENVECECFLLHGKGVIGYLKELPKLRKKIMGFRPDVLHAHYGLSCLVANLATRSVPVVSTYHGSDINNPKVRPFSKIAMWLSAWNIFVSQRNVDIANPHKHWSLIPCGITLPQPWNELQKQKVEQLTLNQWVGSVLKKGKKHVLFAGAFDNSVKDPKLAQTSVSLLDNVQLIELKGYDRNQVTALMYKCDAFLMTSQTEGSPQVIKEALACGCPIVSVDVGDVAERINGVDGCYIVLTREPSDIAATLRIALSFAGKTKGSEKIVADGLTNDIVAKKLVGVYEDIIER